MENNNEINTRKNKTEFNTYRDWDTRWEMKLDTLLIILTLNRLQIEEWDKKNKQTHTIPKRIKNWVNNAFNTRLSRFNSKKN